MEPVIEYREATVLVGLSTQIVKIQTPSQENRARIAALWQELAAKAPPDVLAGQRAALMEPPSGELGEAEDYFGGLIWPSGKDTPPGLLRRELPGGNYLYYLQQGPISRLGESLGHIYGQLLAQSGRRRGVGPDLALYGGEGSPMSEGFELSLWVPLEPGE